MDREDSVASALDPLNPARDASLRETLRNLVESGDITPQQAAAFWPKNDRAAGIVQWAADCVSERTDDTAGS